MAAAMTASFRGDANRQLMEMALGAWRRFLRLNRIDVQRAMDKFGWIGRRLFRRQLRMWPIELAQVTIQMWFRWTALKKVARKTAPTAPMAIPEFPAAVYGRLRQWDEFVSSYLRRRLLKAQANAMCERALLNHFFAFWDAAVSFRKRQLREMDEAAMHRNLHTMCVF
jgi:hypothetical protein